MARASQTETAVLGALSVMPMTGYALREAIRDVLGHFWSESFGQIYPALGELEQRGHVQRVGSGRTGASTFAITPPRQPCVSLSARSNVLARKSNEVEPNCGRFGK